MAASPARASFGIAPGSLTTTAAEADGTIDSQAGSHPYAYTIGLAFNQNAKGEPEGALRDARIDLPPGLIGNPLAVPRCSRPDFEGQTPHCPGDTQIGIAKVELQGAGLTESPVFNLVPPPGVLARFGFAGVGFNDFQDASLRTGAGYGITLATSNIPIAGIRSVTETIWGVPPAPGHDPERQCYDRQSETVIHGCSSEAEPRPLLTLPGSCTGPLTTIVSADSAEAPGVYRSETALSLDAGGNPSGLFGCERLAFTPSIALAPDTSVASAPTGLRFDLHVPGNEEPGGLATAAVREIRLALPEGLTLNPALANGLLGCPLLQGNDPLKEAGEERGEEIGIDLESRQPANCPDASKIGEVKLETPLLDHPLSGWVYLAAQDANPFGSLLAVYLAVQDPATGIVVKLAGEVQADEATGRLTMRFPELPQLPFEDMQLTLWGGAGAPLVNPAACATSSTASLLSAWSAAAAEPVTATPSSAFTVDQGCGPRSFAPSFAAGSLSNQAGAYSPFALTLSRTDSEQELGAVQATLPPGVLANLASVTPCGDAQANAGTCPAPSQIATVTVSAGAGPQPVPIAGTVYLTGPSAGAPFGVAIELPAILGPFDLDENGIPLVIHGSIRVDPATAQASLQAGPFPRMLRGIPLLVRSLELRLSRPGFTLNPTNCSPLSVAGAVTSIQGAVAGVSSPFTAVNCATLHFTPTIQVSTPARPSAANGATVVFKITYPPVPDRGKNAQGSQAWLSEAKLDLPRQLPVRLTTLQRACLASTFKSSPAACPAASLIGRAVLHTQVLAVPLSGPVYFVSHGAARFPEVVMVLQGAGVSLQIHGDTSISPRGIASVTFRNIPDVPFDDVEVTLPAGPNSEFGSNLPASAKGSFCAQNVRMPTVLQAQNGAVLHQSTKVTVTGCPNRRTRAQRRAAALAACRRKHAPTRKSCEQAARRRYRVTRK